MAKKPARPTRKSPAKPKTARTAGKRVARAPAKKKPARPAARKVTARRPAKPKVKRPKAKPAAKKKTAPKSKAKPVSKPKPRVAKPVAKPAPALKQGAKQAPVVAKPLAKQPAGTKGTIAQAGAPVGKHPAVPAVKPTTSEIAAKIAGKRAEDAAQKKKGRNGRHAEPPRELTAADVEARKRRLKTLIVLGKERGFLKIGRA